MPQHVAHSNRNTLASILLFGLIFACYANSLEVPWYFDDLLRIVNNPAVHWDRFSLPEILKSIYYTEGPAGIGGTLHRPLAMMSFGFNWLLFGADVTGYHLTNLAIHFFTALVLYHTLHALLQLSSFRVSSKENLQLIALGATVLWALNPIQIQAITYIVQRSTSLAGLFSILAVYLYLRARTAPNRYALGSCVAGCIGCYCLATASKLNAIILPGSLWLIEILFFQDLEQRASRRRAAWFTVGVGTFLLMGSLVFLWSMKGNLADYFDLAYKGRPFSLAERLLTEPRVLLFYLSQIVWPLPGRFSLVHAPSISTSLVDPWTTLPALVLVLGLIALGMAAMRRYPFLALAILFFFLNHLIESTLIPLELVFEHRNYLPSMFLFVPPVIVFQKGLEYCRQRRRPLAAALCAGGVAIIVALGLSTYQRNDLWGNKKLFWEDALVKAPRSARPYLQLAAYHAAHDDWPLALKLYHHSLDLYDPAPQRARALAHTNIGVLLNKMQQPEPAIDHFRHALSIFPEHEIARYNLIFTLLSRGDWQPAMDHAEILLAKNPHHPYYLNAAGLIALQLGNLEEAKAYLVKALAQAPRDVNTLINLGALWGRFGQYNLGAPLLERAMRLAPQDPTPRLCLIDLNLKGDQNWVAEGLVRDLVTQIPLGVTMERLQNARAGIELFDVGRVRPVILTYLGHARIGTRR